FSAWQTAHCVVKIRSPSDWAAPAAAAKPIRARAAKPRLRTCIGNPPVLAAGDYRPGREIVPGRPGGASGVRRVMAPEAAEGIEHEAARIAPAGLELLGRAGGQRLVRSLALHQLLHQAIEDGEVHVAVFLQLRAVD